MSGMKDMTQGSVTRHLLHMASFMAVSMVVQTLYLLADLYWVGRLGKEAIAAVGLSGNLMMLVVALTQMLGVGTTTVISHAAGRKDQTSAEKAFNQSIVLSLVVAILFGICSFPFRTQYSQSLSAKKARNGESFFQISGRKALKRPLLATRSQYRANRRRRCMVGKSMQLVWRIS